MPSGMGWAATVPFEDSFIVAGGDVVGLGVSDQIMRYDPLQPAWVPMPTRLNNPRNYFSAFMIPDGYVNCTSRA